MAGRQLALLTRGRVSEGGEAIQGILWPRPFPAARQSNAVILMPDLWQTERRSVAIAEPRSRNYPMVDSVGHADRAEQLAPGLSRSALSIHLMANRRDPRVASPCCLGHAKRR